MAGSCTASTVNLWFNDAEILLRKVERCGTSCASISRVYATLIDIFPVPSQRIATISSERRLTMSSNLVARAKYYFCLP